MGEAPGVCRNCHAGEQDFSSEKFINKASAEQDMKKEYDKEELDREVREELAREEALIDQMIESSGIRQETSDFGFHPYSSGWS